MNGLETDENGNVSFNPEAFLKGLLAGSAGSLALSKGLKVINKNPKFKEALKEELKDTLAKGWQNATKQYPFLKMLEPMNLHIMKSEAGKNAQASFVLSKLEKEALKSEKYAKIKALKEKGKNLDKNNKVFKVSNDEAKELYEHFKFKGNKPLIREIRQDEINHALKSHGDEAKESARGNIAINEKEIYKNYPKITQDYTDKFFTDKGVIYVKQINGYFIAIEEVLSGKDKMIFKTAWKTKGQYNKEVLLRKVKATSNPSKEG